MTDNSSPDATREGATDADYVPAADGIQVNGEFESTPRTYRWYLIRLLGFGGLFVGLYYVQAWNFLLFHSFAELFSIVIAGGVFLIAWNSRKRMASNFFIIIGVAYASVAFLDLIHTLAYAGMGVFPGHGADLPTQLWLGARYVEAISLLAGTAFVASSRLQHRFSIGQNQTETFGLVVVYIAVTAVVIGTIFLGVFPTAYVEGVGLTDMKILSEYVIIAILGITLGLLYQNRDVFETDVFRYLAVAILLTIGAEFMFTLYFSVYGFSNMAGHVFKIASFYFLYVSVIKTGVTNPQEVLFRQLSQERNELADRTEALERQNTRLDRFASLVSHDLRNPLNVAQGRLDLAGEESDSEHLAHASMAIDRSLGLIDDMLSLARAGKHVSEKEWIELGPFAETCWSTVETGDAKITVDVACSIKADRSRLQQLIENLFRNAIDHGGPDVTIRIGRLPDGFFIEDDGPGIAPEKRDSVFESGYTTNQTGTGFGLAIVSEIVDAHGWEIRISESAEGGARFELSGIEIERAVTPSA